MALLARDRTRLDSVAREVRALGRRAMPLSVDVADAEALDNAVDASATM